MTLVSVMVAVLILLAGVAVLVRTMPAIRGLSVRAEGAASAAMVADRIFTVLERVYGDGDGPAVPASVEGADPEFARYRYRAFFNERKPGLFQIEMEVATLREGRPDTRIFFHVFRRREGVQSP